MVLPADPVLAVPVAAVSRAARGRLGGGGYAEPAGEPVLYGGGGGRPCHPAFLFHPCRAAWAVKGFSAEGNIIGKTPARISFLLRTGRITERKKSKKPLEKIDKVFFIDVVIY